LPRFTDLTGSELKFRIAGLGMEFEDSSLTGMTVLGIKPDVSNSFEDSNQENLMGPQDFGSAVPTSLGSLPEPILRSTTAL
jgi:hypothetical protein